MLVYEFKLSGTQQQYRLIDEAIRTALFVRNSCVRYWMDNAKIGKYDLSARCRALSKEFSFANKLNSMARQASAERAWSSISRFYENCKKKIKGKKADAFRSGSPTMEKHQAGYPKFKRRGNSVEYKTSGWALSEDRKHLALTDGHKIGRMKLVGTYDLHYYQIEQIKRVRLVRRADGYYAQFLIKAERNIDTTPTGKTIGLDVGLNHFYTDSNGEQVENPRFLRKSEKSIKRLQKRVSRKFSKARKQEKIKQSNNYSKAKNKLSRKHLKVSRQRKDHAVKLARCVVASNDVVVYEDLRVANMVKNRKLAKSISDASWYQFRVWIEYFGRIFGRTTIAVAPQYTSQDCSNCGKRVQKTLSTRTHKCPHCGYTADRDENAAINILKKGIATAGHVGSSGLAAQCAEVSSAYNCDKTDPVNVWGDLSSTGNDVNQS
jgi:putative transposase